MFTLEANPEVGNSLHNSMTVSFHLILYIKSRGMAWQDCAGGATRSMGPSYKHFVVDRVAEPCRRHQTFQVPKMEESSPISAVWVRLMYRKTPK